MNSTTRKKVIGLTGNIGCGKSSVSNEFRKFGADIIDADIISRQIFEKKEVIDEINASFPKAVVNGRIDRKILGDIVFSDKKKLEKLNLITHKKILSIIKEKIKNSESDLVIVDAALLYEAGLENIVDKVIVVYCNEKLQIDRVMKRDKISREDALKRIKSQMNQQIKIDKSDFCIDNSGDIDELHNKVKNIVIKDDNWR